MLIAQPTLRRLVASLALAVLAVFAVLSSAHAGLHAHHAGLHAPGGPHGPARHVGQLHDHVAASGGALADQGAPADQGDTALPDAPDCPCCHGVAAGLADLLPPSAQADGPRRPPRHP